MNEMLLNFAEKIIGINPLCVDTPEQYLQGMAENTKKGI